MWSATNKHSWRVYELSLGAGDPGAEREPNHKPRTGGLLLGDGCQCNGTRAEECDGTTPYPDACGEPGGHRGILVTDCQLASTAALPLSPVPPIYNFPPPDVSVVTARLACTRRHMERLAASVEGEFFSDSEQGDDRHTDWCVPSSVAGGWSPRSAALPTPAPSHQLPAGLLLLLLLSSVSSEH